MRNKVSPHRTA